MTELKLKTNLTCSNCVNKVRPYLDQNPEVESWTADPFHKDHLLQVTGDEIDSELINQELQKAGFSVTGEFQEGEDSSSVETVPLQSKEKSAESTSHEHDHHAHHQEANKSFWQAYKPLLLTLFYLLGVVAIVEINAWPFDGLRAMSVFMGGFFIAFSFFKLLDLSGFVESYQTYDIIAHRWRGYGFAYPFIELGLGVSYLLGLFPTVTNGVTLAIMLIGLLGVSHALLQKRQIQCACLGSLFDLPMSKVTFIEDAVMAAMAAIMLGMY